MTNERFPSDNHSVLAGYIFWIFGFTGSHRFYYGKKWTGLLWFLTGGLLLIGWIIDLFLIPSMDEEAEITYISGDYNYNIAWLLLTFGGFLGLHRFYLKKWGTGIIWLLTGGLFTLVWLYDLWNLNDMVSAENKNL